MKKTIVFLLVLPYLLFLCVSCGRMQTSAPAETAACSEELFSSPTEEIDAEALAYARLRTVLQEQGEPFRGEGKSNAGYTIPSYEKCIFGEIDYTHSLYGNATVLICVGLVGDEVEITVDCVGGYSTFTFLEDGQYLELSIKKKNAFDCAERATRGKMIDPGPTFSDKHVVESGGTVSIRQPRSELLFAMEKADEILELSEIPCSFEALGYKYIRI